MTKTALTAPAAEGRLDDRRHGPPADRGSGSGGPLERVTVNLIPRASRALQRLVDLTGDSKTDIINRALQVYLYMEETTTDGGDIYVREPKDSEPRLVKML